MVRVMHPEDVRLPVKCGKASGTLTLTREGHVVVDVQGLRGPLPVTEFAVHGG